MTSTAMARAGEGLQHVIELESRLDRELPRPWLVGPPRRELLAVAQAWSAAVWEAAALDEPIVPDAEAVEWGLSIGRRPVFVCGVHRSGTTLVRDLLDDHPALVVLPAEGTYFTNFRRHVARRPRAEALDTIGAEWVRRLANPTNRPPYWLLGRSEAHGSPYVAFARRLRGWWPLVHGQMGRDVSSWPLLAVALAYATSRADRPLRAIRHWVEKTPTNERWIDLLWKEFPDARILHVVREPNAVVASRKVLEQSVRGSFPNLHAVLRDLAATYRVAAAHAGDTGGRYCLVRYEELTASPGPTVARLAAFLEIPDTPALRQPTVAGRPAVNNSAFGADADASRISAARPAPPGILTPSECEHIVAAVGRLAAAVGYDVGTIGAWRRRYLNVTRRSACALRAVSPSGARPTTPRV